MRRARRLTVTLTYAGGDIPARPGKARISGRDAHDFKIVANRCPVAWLWMYCLAWVVWFSEPFAITVGHVSGSSIEPLSPTRYMAIPELCAS